MIIPKNKITSKLVISYVIALLFIVLAFVLFYKQLIRLAETSNQSIDFNEHVFLISETITDLYETESLGRNLIKKNDSIDFIEYEKKISKINTSIDKLVLKYPDTSQRVRINSIKDLLRRKNKNIHQLIKIYENKSAETYYATAIKELKKIDPTFKDYTYENRFQNLKKHQRKYLINLLEYSKFDNQENLSNKTIDSIATSVTNVLLKLSKKEKQLQRSIEAREEEILESDRVLTSKIRSMLTSMEFEELKLYSKQSIKSKQILSYTYKIMLFSTLLTLLMAVTFLFLISKDVDKDNENRIALEKAKNYSDKLVKNRESLINMVTHDIRAPLNTIMGFLELLETTGKNHKNQHYIAQMQRSSEYMLHLVNDLLDFSKAEAGKLAVDKISFQPNLIIENAIRQALPTKDLKNIKLSTIIDEKLEQLFISDPYRIRQIAVNLIGNAYKFTEEGFVKVTAELKYKTKKDPYLKLTISDSGIGIRKEQQKIIFDAFAQSKKADQKKGFGLGLFITKSLIDLLGGEMVLNSEFGKGTTFECRIPLQEVANSEPINTLPKTATFDEELLVVLVDDEETQLVFLEAILEKNKINYKSFQNGEEAITYIEQQLPTIVLTDIQMPIINGFELVKKLKSNVKTSQIPVIGLTGNSSFAVEAFETTGFSAHLLKPYKPDVLLNKIGELVGTKIPSITSTKTTSSLSYKNENYDLTDLISFMDNDMDDVKKIIATFYQSTQEHMKNWTIAIQENNSELIKQIAHKMYPMFMQIKAVKVAHQLRVIDIEKNVDEVTFFANAKGLKEEITTILKHLGGLKL